MAWLESDLDLNQTAVATRVPFAGGAIAGLSHARRASVQALDAAVVWGTHGGDEAPWGALAHLQPGEIAELPPLEAVKLDPASARGTVLAVFGMR